MTLWQARPPVHVLLGLVIALLFAVLMVVGCLT